MSSPVVVVDGEEYRFLAVTTVLNTISAPANEIHYIHCVAPKTGELHSFESHRVTKIHKMS